MVRATQVIDPEGNALLLVEIHAHFGVVLDQLGFPDQVGLLMPINIISAVWAKCGHVLDRRAGAQCLLLIIIIIKRQLISRGFYFIVRVIVILNFYIFRLGYSLYCVWVGLNEIIAHWLHLWQLLRARQVRMNFRGRLRPPARIRHQVR